MRAQCVCSCDSPPPPTPEGTLALPPASAPASPSSAGAAPAVLPAASAAANSAAAAGAAQPTAPAPAPAALASAGAPSLLSALLGLAARPFASPAVPVSDLLPQKLTHVPICQHPQLVSACIYAGATRIMRSLNTHTVRMHVTFVMCSCIMYGLRLTPMPCMSTALQEPQL